MSQLQEMMSADMTAFLASQNTALQSDPGTAQEAPAPAAAPVQADAAAPTATAPAQTADSGQPPAANTPSATGVVAEEDEFDIDLDSAPPPAEQAEAENVDAALSQAEASADPDDEIGKLLATTRGKRIYGSFKKDQTLAKTEDEGGIGHAPTVDQIKEYHRAYVEARSLENDFHSGTREGMERWANKYFSPDNQASQAAAQHLIGILAQQNQNAFLAAAEPVMDQYAKAAIPRFLSAMEQTQDEARKQAYWMAAQELHYDVYGRYFNPPAASAQPQQQPNQPHPAELELARLRREMANSQQQAVATQAQALQKEIDSAFERALNGDVDKALEPVKGKVPDIIYRGIRTDYLNRVREAVSKNQQALADLNTSKNAIARQQARQEIPNLVRRYRQMALEPLRAYRAEYLNAAGREAKTASDQRHAQLQQAASKTEPQASAAAPVQRDLTPAITRQPNETQAQFMDRMMKADFQRFQTQQR